MDDFIRNLRKDFRIELRNRRAFQVAFAFGAITTVAVSLASGGRPFDPPVQAILLWVITFFCAMNGLLHIFTREEEEQTALFLRLNSSPEAVFGAKLVFNCIFFLSLQLVVTPLFLFFLQVDLPSPLAFAATVGAGGLAIAASVSLLGAIVAKAGGKGALFTVISFPVVLPILWIAITTTILTLEGDSPAVKGNILFLLAFSIAVMAISFLLFRYIWLDK